MPVRRVVWPYVAEDASTREAGRELADAIREHRDHRGPSLVELVLPSHMQAWTGVWNVAGLEQLTIEALT
jgi:hypothetical protein